MQIFRSYELKFALLQLIWPCQSVNFKAILNKSVYASREFRVKQNIPVLFLCLLEFLRLLLQQLVINTLHENHSNLGVGYANRKSTKNVFFL